MPTRPANTWASAASRCQGCKLSWIRIRIRGGGPLSGEIAIGGAKNAALPLMACGLLTDERLVLTNVAAAGRHRDHGRAAAPARHRGRAIGRRAQHLARRAHHQHRGAVRHRAQDARLDPRARPAARPSRRGPGLAARRLRHRHPPGRSAPEGPGAMGAKITLDGGYIDAAAPQAAEGRDHRLPLRLGRRHREPADGRLPGRRRAPRWPTPRASRRSPTSPHCLIAMGAQHRGHRHRHAGRSRA